MSDARKFQQLLGAELASLFSAEFRFFRSRLELRRSAIGGADVVILAGSTKWSPKVSVDFYFGKSFDRVRSIERALGIEGLPYHIQQYSVNRAHMDGISYAGPHTWQVNLQKPPLALVRELKGAIEGIAYPFFERFRDIRVARDAMASGDRWCFGGTPFWRSLFLLDAALDDMAHFRQWSSRLDAFYSAQVEEMLGKYERTRSALLKDAARP